ncbi:MAG: DUF503 domain-containing protein [Candidatus Electryonea clarkiae]|nr:DUF503 domain-containing protein [Candidatus Electryonea clarkiae]MDP8286604.1 DUF503 domain-containing protein [Candidatus Electryonea clarkiae]
MRLDLAAAIGLLELDILIPGSSSLKDKRRVIRSIKDKIRGKFNVSIAEVGYQELHGRTHLGIVTISTSRKDAEERLQALFKIIDSELNTQVIEHKTIWL